MLIAFMYLGALCAIFTPAIALHCVCVCLHCLQLPIEWQRVAACNWQTMKDNTRRIRNYLLMLLYQRQSQSLPALSIVS